MGTERHERIDQAALTAAKDRVSKRIEEMPPLERWLTYQTLYFQGFRFDSAGREIEKLAPRAAK